MKVLTTDCTDATDGAAETSHEWVHLILIVGHSHKIRVIREIRGQMVWIGREDKRHEIFNHGLHGCHG